MPMTFNRLLTVFVLALGLTMQSCVSPLAVADNVVFEHTLGNAEDGDFSWLSSDLEQLEAVPVEVDISFRDRIIFEGTDADSPVAQNRGPISQATLLNANQLLLDTGILRPKSRTETAPLRLSFSIKDLFAFTWKQEKLEYGGEEGAYYEQQNDPPRYIEANLVVTLKTNDADARPLANGVGRVKYWIDTGSPLFRKNGENVLSVELGSYRGSFDDLLLAAQYEALDALIEKDQFERALLSLYGKQPIR